MNKFLLLLTSVFVVGCVIAQTTIDDSISVGGITREYRLYIPATYNGSEEVPLVFNLHGMTSNHIQQEIFGDFRPIADTANFIICHPMGLIDNNGNTHWNCVGTSSVDDVGFLSALIDTLATEYSINLNRVYSTGMSNGGFMSSELACTISERIAAIACVAGSMTHTEFANCTANRPMPFLKIHGTNDFYNGNTSYVGIEDLVNHWVTFNQCDTVPIITQLPDVNTADSSTVTHYVYQNGQSGSTVELYKVNNGGHTWPGSIISQMFLTGTNMDFNASKEIWRFFSQYELGGMLSTFANTLSEKDVFEVFPNPIVDNTIQIRFNVIGRKQISLYSQSGQLVHAVITDDQNITIHTPAAKGVYYLSLSVAANSHIVKLINK